MSCAQEHDIVLFTHSCKQKHQLKTFSGGIQLFFTQTPNSLADFSQGPPGGGGGGERRDLGVNCTISARFTFVAYFLLVPHRAVGVYFVAYLYFS